jgi:hypothetical protein
MTIAMASYSTGELQQTLDDTIAKHQNARSAENNTVLQARLSDVLDNGLVLSAGLEPQGRDVQRLGFFQEPERHLQDKVTIGRVEATGLGYTP